jgi:hypothetical protein
MYSWKTIRAVCTVLLLVPLVHLAWLKSGEVRAVLDPSPEVWAPELAAYDLADQAGLLPESPIVVVGGRRVKLWRHLEALLAPAPVLMRGLGDATVNDITHHYARLIGYYRPDTVVLLPGNSEFHIRDAKTAEELAEAIRELEAVDAHHGVTRRFYVFTPLRTPLHPGDDRRIKKVTRLLMAWAAPLPRVTVLDANPLLEGTDGRPDPDFFRIDGVNLNEHGYLRLSLLLREVVMRDRATEKGARQRERTAHGTDTN